MNLLRSVPPVLVVIILTSPSYGFAASKTESDDLHWTEIKQLTQIGAQSATLTTNWKSGTMNFVLLLNGPPKQSLNACDIELRFPIETKPVVDLHLWGFKFSSVNEKIQLCRTSISLTQSTYTRLMRSGKWQLGIAKRSYSSYGPESDKYYGVATFFDPRIWYGDGTSNSSKPRVRDVCHVRSSQSGVHQAAVWYQIPWNEQTDDIHQFIR